MKNFLAENWLWIATPFVLVITLVAVAVMTTGDAVGPFIYNVF